VYHPPPNVPTGEAETAFPTCYRGFTLANGCPERHELTTLWQLCGNADANEKAPPKRGQRSDDSSERHAVLIVRRGVAASAARCFGVAPIFS
jgi:hypothetical protein